MVSVSKRSNGNGEAQPAHVNASAIVPAAMPVAVMNRFPINDALAARIRERDRILHQLREQLLAVQEQRLLIEIRKLESATVVDVKQGASDLGKPELAEGVAWVYDMNEGAFVQKS